MTIMLQDHVVELVKDRREIRQETILHFVGYKVSTPCPSEFTRDVSRTIYTNTIVIFQVQETSNRVR